MDPPTTRKRLRVRLKATDGASLARTFGPHLREGGAFVPRLKKVTEGDQVRLELMFSDGSPALLGNGQVVSTGPKGADLEIEWDDDAWPLLLEVLSNAAPVSEDVASKANTEDLDNAAPGTDSLDLGLSLPTPDLVVPARKLVTEEVDVSQVLLEVPDGVDEPIEFELNAPLIAQGFVTDEPASPSTSEIDLVSDLMGPGAEAPAREPGEVTPLARIELVRRDPERIRTGEVKPLLDEPSAFDTAIPSKRDRRPVKPRGAQVLGIDVGGAFVRTAYVAGDEPTIIASRRGQDGVPAAVVIEVSGKTIVGEPALRQLARHKGVHGTKRLLGRTPTAPIATKLEPWLPYLIDEGEEGEVAAGVGAQFIALEEITALLLKEARCSAELAVDGRHNRAVLTCPSSYGIRQRQALRTAAELAGLVVERIVSTPLAVAVHHLRDQPSAQRRLLVVDFGASQLDVALVVADNGRFRLESSWCRADLGGIEFDRAIARRLASEVERAVGEKLDLRHETMVRLVLAAETAKRELADRDTTQLAIDHPLATREESFHLDLDLDRARVDDLTSDLLDDVVRVCTRAANSAGEIDAIVGVGGQLLDPTVRARLEALFGDRFVIEDAERAPVFGAAAIGSAIAAGAMFPMQECSAVSIGMIGADGAPDPLIAPNTVCPISAARAWSIPDDASMVCLVYEGTESIEPIYRVTLDPASAGPPLDAELVLALDGAMTLSVSANNRVDGARIPVVLTPPVSTTNARVEVESAAEAEEAAGVFGWIKRKLSIN